MFKQVRSDEFVVVLYPVQQPFEFKSGGTYEDKLCVYKVPIKSMAEQLVASHHNQLTKEGRDHISIYRKRNIK